MGPPSGTDWVWYPMGDAFYWQHTRESKRHQAWLDDQAINSRDMMRSLQVIYHEAQKARNRERARQKRKEKKREAIQD